MFKAKYVLLPFLFLFFFLSCTKEKVRPLEELTQAQEMYEEGLKLIRNEDFSDSIVYFTKLLNQFPDDPKYTPWAIYEIGFVFYVKGDDEKAIHYFDKVLEVSKIRGPRILADLLKKKIQTGNGYKNSTY